MSNPCAVFDFTAHDVDETFEPEPVRTILQDHCKKWSFQLERGEQTGKLHLQGRFSLKVRARLHTLQNLFGVKWHFSITSTENRDNTFYVTKAETRVRGPWRDDDPYIPRQIREITELYHWQQQVINSAKTWDTRHINILIDEDGNHGKSILKTYIGVNRIGRALPYLNDYRDIMRIVMDTPKVPLYIIDIPRALKKEGMNAFFSAIETLKDGYAYDDRYTFKEQYFDCPNIWVFMNRIPDTGHLSKDRWVFWKFIQTKRIHRFDPQG